MDEQETTDVPSGATPSFDPEAVPEVPSPPPAEFDMTDQPALSVVLAEVQDIHADMRRINTGIYICAGLLLALVLVTNVSVKDTVTV